MDQSYIIEVLPLPYRVVLLLNLGLFLWYVNIITCRQFQIDLPLVLKLTHPDINNTKLVNNAKSTLLKVTVSNLVNYLVYLFFYTNGLQMPLLNWFPLMALVLFVFILCYPSLFSNQISVEGQRLSQTIKRVIIGGIDPKIRTNDILLTDTLTSYNKTIIDFFVYISGLLLGLETLPLSGQEISKNHMQLYNIDLLLANFPSALRLKQCLYEYKVSKYQNRTHLLNAIKYSTAFFPTICLILKRNGYLQNDKAWVFFSLINSSYSFFWDISNDWNFGFFYKYISGHKNMPLLRHKLIYNVNFYLLAIGIDFMLRFLWIFKILYAESKSTTFFAGLMIALFTTELGSFVSQLLEITRRWIWVFVKVETEYIKMRAAGEDMELQNMN